MSGAPGASNALKQPLTASLNQIALKQALDQLHLTGKALPAKVVKVDFAIITVEFAVNADPFTMPQIRVPLFGPEWIRYPIQVGSMGVLFPVDTYIDHVTALGVGGTPDLTPPGNLAALVFFPCANANWRKNLIDMDQVTAYGPDGVSLTTSNNDWTFRLTHEGIGIYSGNQLIMSFDGGFQELNIFNRDLRITNGDLIVDGLSFRKHLHGGVTPGGGNTGEPSGNGP